MRRAIAFLAAWTVLGLSHASAQNWYDSIFPETAHNFGTVARGSKVTHSFRIINTTSYDVHIAGWRTKCGCTDVKVGAREIPPGTQTTVEATLDTTKFQGYKASGLILVFDRPSLVEVDLNLECFIRGDVMLSPGVVDFQVVPRGQKRSMTMNLSYYGGRPDWGVTEIHTISDHITATLREVSRQGGTVQYQLTTTLKDSAPSGYLRDEITLQTNEANQVIPVSVSANVQQAVTVAPSILNLGHVRPGQEVTKTVLVKAAQPFKVTEVTSQKPDNLTASKTFEGEKAFHALQITLKAPSQPGPFNAILEIATDLKGEPPAKLTTFATVGP